VRLPLVVRGPGIGQGQSVSIPVANVDLAPTIADAAKTGLGVEADGVSLLGALREEQGPPRRNILLEGFEELPFAGVRTPDG
jgi:arylsulfatase A-like enzyme